MGQHIVFVVDECHRALSAENMEEIKKMFPKSTWFGFTGTPISLRIGNKPKGNYITTHDQYGEILHTYTIKNALEDGSVLGFQVEHENTVEPTSLENKIYRKLKEVETYAEYSPEQINRMIDQMEPVKKKVIWTLLFLKQMNISKKSFIKCSVQTMPIQNLIFEMAVQRSLRS
ncbi:DEAD/DEAH box helicase family protein [Enterococcus lactis]|nr:DEAD/DEAH box helicase family protein [Enterococcus lactis]